MSERIRNIKLYVGNLPFDATEDDLRSLLHGCGQIRFIIVRKNAQTNKSKGYAHVEYRHERECVEAFKALVGKEIRGRPLKIDWCDDVYREKYPDLMAAAAAAFYRQPPSPAQTDQAVYPVVASGVPPPIVPYSQYLPPASPAPAEVKRARSEGVLLLDGTGKLVSKDLLRVIKGMTMYDVYNLVKKINALIAKSPNNARSILSTNMNMCKALVHAKLLLGSTDDKLLNSTTPCDVKTLGKEIKLFKGGVKFLEVRFLASVRNLPDVTGKLVLLDNGDLDQNVKIEVLHDLVKSNVFILDDRIQRSLEDIKISFKNAYYSAESIMKIVEILHGIKDVNGLMNLLPYFLYDLSFTPSRIVTKILYIYSIACPPSPLLKALHGHLIEYIMDENSSFTIDDRMMCILSAFDVLDRDFIYRVLSNYAKYGDSFDDPLISFKCNLTSMRIYDKLERRIEGFISKSITTLDNFLKERSSDDCTDIIVRFCTILVKLSIRDGFKENLNILENAWKYISKGKLTTKSATYMLNCTSGDLKRQILSFIIPNISQLTKKELIILTKNLNRDAISLNAQRTTQEYSNKGDSAQRRSVEEFGDVALLLESQCLLYIGDLCGTELVDVITFYSRHGASDLLLDQFLERLLAIYGEMHPLDLSKCIILLNKLQICDYGLVKKYIKFVYDNIISMDPKSVSFTLYAFKLLKCPPPLKIISNIMQRDLKQYNLTDLIQCIYSLPTRGYNDIFQLLINNIELKLDHNINLKQLTTLALAVKHYKRQPFMSSLYSIVYAKIPAMNAKQLTIIWMTYSYSNLRTQGFIERINYHLIPKLDNIQQKEIANLLSVVRNGTATRELLEFVNGCSLSSVDRFELFDVLVDVDKLTDVDVIRCLLALGSKGQNSHLNAFARQLYNRLIKIAPLLSTASLTQISTSIANYGYRKPKVDRILANLIARQTVKKQYNKIDTNIYCFFRPIAKGPPHLDFKN